MTADTTHPSTPPADAPRPGAARPGRTPRGALTPDAVQFPAGRYGRRRDPRRPRRQRLVNAIVGLVVVVAMAGIAVKLYRQYAQAPYQVTIVGVTDLTDSQVTVTFDVTHPAGSGALCTVLGHTRDGHEVGRAEVEVPADDQTTTRVTYTLATTARPMTGEVQGCGPEE